jgi:pyruvate kinase
MQKYTKIVATIGPACEKMSVLEEMVKNGVNVARLNFSHGTHDNHQELVKSIRAVEKKLGVPIAIMQDLQGPKIRLGNMPEKGLEVKKGDKIIFDTTQTEFKNNLVPITYQGLEKSLSVGEHFLIDDGRIEVNIEKISKGKIFAEVIEPGILLSHKGLNFPHSVLNIPALSEKDKDDLEFGVAMGVEYVALSFVHTGGDIIQLRKLIEKIQKKQKIKKQTPIFIIAKIERHEAIEHLDDILSLSDGVMVARGDLGLEIPAEEVPLLQKTIVAKANTSAKPVIVATQMLDSMQKSARPTRAEVSDVANAVIDHADAVMLSNETAAGAHPALVVKTMADIIAATEKSAFDDLPLPAVGVQESTEMAVTELSRIIAQEVQARLIMAASISGETGRLISRVRPMVPVLVATNNERVWRQLNLSWGVQSFILPTCKSIEELVSNSVEYIKQNKIAKKGDKMVIVAGEPVGEASKVNLVEVREVK